MSLKIHFSSLKGSLYIFASALCFASYGVWARLLGHQFAIFYQGWVRSAIILLILLPFVIYGKQFKPIQKGDQKWFITTMIFSLFTQVPLYFAYNHLPLGTATFIFYGFFLITSYGVGWAFLSEKITVVKVISLLLAFLGLFLTFGLSLAIFSVSAMTLAALNGIASGGEIATSKKSTHRYSSLQVCFYAGIWIFLTHFPISILLGEPSVPFSLYSEWGVMLVYAVSGIGGFWLVIEGFRYVDASIGGLIGLLEIPLSVLFGILFFSDQLTLAVILGGVFIIASAILPDVYGLRHRGEKPLPPPTL